MVVRDDVPEPVPGSGQVLVAVKACGICGSDLHFAKHGRRCWPRRGDGGHARHRMAGTRPVRRRLHGPRVHRRGARGRTRHRRARRRARSCTSVPVLLSATGDRPIVYSNTTLGGYAERMLLSAPLLLPVPNGLDAAARRADRADGGRPARREHVGDRARARARWCSAAGRSGMAVIAALTPSRASNPSWPRTSRPPGAALAVAMGAHEVRRPGARASPCRRGARRPVVFEAVGVPGIIDDVAAARAGAAAGWSSSACAWSPTRCTPFFGIVKELSLQFVFGYDPMEFAESLRAIAEGEIDVAPLITGEVGLDGVAGGVRRSGRPRRALQDPRTAVAQRIGCLACRSPPGPELCCVSPPCCSTALVVAALPACDSTSAPPAAGASRAR